MNCQDLESARNDGRTQVIDVRSPSEFAAGHIPGALNIPMEHVASRFEDFDVSRPVVLVCHSGDRAEMTSAAILPTCSSVTTLEGGTDAWIKSGRRVIRSTSTAWSLERQVRLTAGMLILSGAILALTVSTNWALLSGFVGAGLVFAGATNVCGMASLFAIMPWNKPRTVNSETSK